MTTVSPRLRRQRKRAACAGILVADLEARIFVQAAVRLEHGVFPAVAVEHHRDRCLEHRTAYEFEFPAERFQRGEREILRLVELAFERGLLRLGKAAAFFVDHGDSPGAPLMPPFCNKRWWQANGRS